MRALIPEPADDVDVHARYADGWTDRTALRVNFVTSVDGASAAGGLSKGLQTPGDNTVFAALRDLADVVLVGSGTARSESYGPIRFSGRRTSARREYGLRDTAPLAVLSASLSLDPDARMFTDVAPDARTIVLTSDTADPDRRRALERVADVVVCGDATVEPQQARAALEQRGHTRMLCEGGPTVLADLVAAGAADELCLSVSPLLAGPGPGRIVAGTEWAAPSRATLADLLEEDGALFCRYRLT